MQELPFQKVLHQVATLDAQPSGENGGILVLVTGALLVREMFYSLDYYWASILIGVVNQVDEEQKPMNYTQAFQLIKDGAGNYFVYNDVFRLVYNA